MTLFYGLIYTVFNRVGQVYIELQTLNYNRPQEKDPLDSESSCKDSKLLSLSSKMAVLPHCA